jgi:hypothetical protein
MTAPDPTMADLAAAVDLGRAGERDAARRRLIAMWDDLGADGDALHRCSVAHFLADLQDDVREELLWDERALSAAQDLTDGRAQEQHAVLFVRGLQPSLQLSLADDHRRLGDPVRAREHVALAEAALDELPDDDYGRLIRSGVDLVREALAAGSTEPLPVVP